MSVSQIVIDAQNMIKELKDLDSLGTALLLEAESSNRYVGSLRQFQDDLDSLNHIFNNRLNADLINRIQQQNANNSEILKENRELKTYIEDYERAIELIMQKYRKHNSSDMVESKINFKDEYNKKLWKIIYEQREKIKEMTAVMQCAASIDDELVNGGNEALSRLRLENKTLRELLQISKQFGTATNPIRLGDQLLEEKGVQTEVEDSSDELSLSGSSFENTNNNSQTLITSSVNTALAVTNGFNTAIVSSFVDNAPTLPEVENNNTEIPNVTVATSSPAQNTEEYTGPSNTQSKTEQQQQQQPQSTVTLATKVTATNAT